MLVFLNYSFLLIFLFSCAHLSEDRGRFLASKKEYSCIAPLKKLTSARSGNQKSDLILPSSIQSFSMDPAHRREHIRHPGYPSGRVRYFSETKREEYRVFINDKGYFVDGKGKLLHSQGAENEDESIAKKAIYIISPKGKIYLSYESEFDILHHSSFLAGGDIIAAGEIVFDRGTVKYIDNQSGHYAPTNRSFQKILELLMNQNVEIDFFRYAGPKDY